MQDGQNLFDPETSFIKGNYWRMGETADALIEADVIEPLIIVGIYNTGDRRIDEYTPVEDRRLGGGQADAYGRMLVEELKPFIDAQYRTLPGSGVLRHGGLFTRWPGHSLPGAAVSVCFFPAGRDVSFGLVAQPGDSQYGRGTSQKPELRIWLDIGTKESTRAVPDARMLRDRLVKQGWKLGESLAYFEAENAEHTESAWAQSVGPMLQFLFPSKE